MGLSEWLKKKKEQVTQAYHDTKDWFKDKYEKAKELKDNVKDSIKKTFDGWKKKKPKISTEGARTGSSTGTGTGTEDNIVDIGYVQPKTDSVSEWKEIIKRRMKIIDEYQKKVEADAEIFEKMASTSYKKTYNFLNKLNDVMDVQPIWKFINNKRKSFNHQMRNEVNTGVSIGNPNLVALMNDKSLSNSEYERKIQDYADSIYQKAKNNLLVTLQEVINETNSFIRVNATKFLQDEQIFLNEKKSNLSNLSKQGESKEKELEKIAAEYAALSLVKEIAEKEIV